LLELQLADHIQEDFNLFQSTLSLIANLFISPPAISEIDKYLAPLNDQIQEYRRVLPHSWGRGLIGGSLQLTIMISAFIVLPKRFKEQQKAIQNNIILLLITTFLLTFGILFFLPIPWQRYIIPILPLTAFWIGFGLTPLSDAVQTFLEVQKTPSDPSKQQKYWLKWTLKPCPFIRIRAAFLRIFHPINNKNDGQFTKKSIYYSSRGPWLAFQPCISWIYSKSSFHSQRNNNHSFPQIAWYSIKISILWIKPVFRQQNHVSTYWINQYNSSCPQPNKTLLTHFSSDYWRLNHDFSFFLGQPKTLAVWFIIRHTSGKFHSLPGIWCVFI